MIWILGSLAVICITSWVLGWYCVNVSLELIAFFSGITLFAVLAVCLITHLESSRDYGFMEGYMGNRDAGDAISSARFLELYTKYKGENRIWITRQFNARPSKVW